MKTTPNTLRLLTLLLAWFCTFPALAEPPQEKTGQVSLPGTETIGFHSVVTKQHYQLHVALPTGYEATGRRYPVLLLLDSDIHFGFVKSVTEALHLAGILPDVILVGIGYGEVTLAQWSRNRDRDFLVTPKPGPLPGDSGNATQFLTFLRDELLPRIETSYRVKAEDRTLLGMSAGAIFAAHILAVSPEMFRRYIIVSPYLIAGQDAILAQETAFSKTHKDIDARVYTALGETELGVAGPGWKTFCSNLLQRNYPGLILHQETFKGLTHFEMAYAAYLNGIKDVFGKRPAPLKTLSVRYPSMAGRYFLSLAGLPIIVKAEGGQLWVYLGPDPAELLPVSDTRFTAKGIPGMEFSFIPDESGQAEILLITQMGFDIAAWRMP